MKYKNAQENNQGSIDCLVLLGDEWLPHTQDPVMDYELLEELGPDDWADIKPRSQAAKDTYKIEQENAVVVSDLNIMDTSIRQIEEALAGDTEALALIAARVATKKELRGKLK